MSSGFLPGGAPVDTGFSNFIDSTLAALGVSNQPIIGQNPVGDFFNSLLGTTTPTAPSGGGGMSMAPYSGLPGGMAVGSPYYTAASGQTRLANRFSPDGVHVYIQRGRPLLFSGDISAVKRVRKVGRLCHRFFPSRYRHHSTSRRRYR